MSAHQRQMPKTFDFSEAEARIYARWVTNGWFKPEIAGPDAEPFVISMPPPNVTGVLHTGHALFVALEDLMIRYERMRGKAALWIPGTDHAGIATQLQVEKQLAEEGTTKHEIGREGFVKRTWEWKTEKGGTIIEQLRRMGASCDWDRERFTLDDGLSAAVQEVFITLWEQGLIYRGPRLVNWSPGLQTAVSDLEVERFEEQAKLYYFKYPVEGGEYIPVATTRPETILGDTAVCVHPQDKRYLHLVGKAAYVPVVQRKIPIISDDYVDMEFGTGALKITPGHDFNDFEIGQRHGLELINIMNRDATINDNGGPYAGLDRFVAREKFWADMESAGLTIKVEPHTLVVPRSQRGGEIVEPLLSDQWFVKMEDIAAKALSAVRDGHVRIVPERYEKIYYHWLENIQDWCISRQLWWGHRIPAWHREVEGDPYGEIYVGRTAPEGDDWIPEEDVLDTWFSSALWPFSTLGWPAETDDFKRYYPTSVLETGPDILFFWVARMIMMGVWFTGKPPFHTVYLHGIVRDAEGRKFSKTLGNAIDPIEIVNKFGADPLRYALVTSGTPGNDVNLDIEWVENSWNFINKIWQMTKFTNSNVEADLEPDIPPKEEFDLPARWLVSRLNKLIKNVQYLFDTYQYGEAGRQIRGFLWDEFAPWYLEISKYPLYNGTIDEKLVAQRVLVNALETCLRLLHPFMPFATEEMWGYLPVKGDALILAEWPQADENYIDEAAETEMELLMNMVRGIRDIRTQYQESGLQPGDKLKALMSPGAHRHTIDKYSYIFGRLCNVPTIELLDDDSPVPERAASVVVNDVSIFIPLEEMVDFKTECARMCKEQVNLEQQISKTERMLENESFVNKARPEVVQRERDRLTDLKASYQQNARRISEFCR